jgi:hypothetical protein
MDDQPSNTDASGAGWRRERSEGTKTAAAIKRGQYRDAVRTDENALGDAYCAHNITPIDCAEHCKHAKRCPSSQLQAAELH